MNLTSRNKRHVIVSEKYKSFDILEPDDNETFERLRNFRASEEFKTAAVALTENPSKNLKF